MKQKFDRGSMQKALEQLADFEKKGNEKVLQSGVLKSLNLDDIKFAGQILILQDGCRRFFSKIVKNENLKTDLHVLLTVDVVNSLDQLFHQVYKWEHAN